MIKNSLYSKYWKVDILSPIHKKEAKDDPNNYRGIAVASHFGKLFNSILKNRLQKFCDLNNLISQEQISGKKSARTADHLTVVRYFIDKYALNGKKNCMHVSLISEKPLTQLIEQSSSTNSSQSIILVETF